MSRNWPRVASPAGDSSLITSAPIHASSCEQVGPACTCVISRMRIPFSASIDLYSPLNARWKMRGGLLVHGLVRGTRRIYVAVDHELHQRGHARGAGLHERGPDVLGLGHPNAEPPHRFRHPVESHVTHDVA